MTWRDSIGTSQATNEGAFIISLESNEIFHIPMSDVNGGQVQFSADGDLAYVSDFDGRVEAIRLGTGDVVGKVRGISELTVFGRAGLIATRR